MIEVIIHIGLHRTGTTFLQKEVFENLEGVNYMFDDSLHRIHIEEGINLVSNEGLSLSMPHSLPYKYHVLDNIRRLFPKAKIIVGIREKESWLKSCYYRYVISGGKLSFKEYKEQYSNHNYDSYLKEVAETFDCVFLYHFEDLKAKPDEVIGKMCEFIGCKVPDYKNVKRNASLKGWQLETLRRLNSYKFSWYLREVIKRLRGTPT